MILGAFFAEDTVPTECENEDPGVRVDTAGDAVTGVRSVRLGDNRRGERGKGLSAVRAATAALLAAVAAAAAAFAAFFFS